MSAAQTPIELSIVLPCLNEEKTLGACLDKIHRSMTDKGVSYEIIVADNGSRDSSASIAVARGARVVKVTARGYGAAIQGGIATARGPHVIFADADDTYQLEQTHELYAATKAGQADMGIACRLSGTIEPGAMPFLHRYLGTPVLTTLINLFFGGQIRDCNSGFRCLRKLSYEGWKVHASGMEFASELLIKAKKNKARIVEVPSGLRRGNPDRVAHLRTWRDGMRHLLFILSEKPQFSEMAGLLMVVFATGLQIVAAIVGPTKLFGLNVFNLHSQALLFVTALTGLQFYLFACYIFLGIGEAPLAVTRRLLNLDEGFLFFVLVASLALEGLAFLATFIVWARSDFGDIHLIDRLLPVMHVLSLPLMTSIGLAGIHAFKRNALFHQPMRSEASPQ
jgi:glycosyltransferase involved in cell wall biosynthesis